MPAEFAGGNRLTLLDSGPEFFPALLADIEAARHEIHLESYIYAADAMGRTVTEALARAAGRGVRVRVLVDGFGAANFAHDFLPALTAAGAQAMLYRPEITRLSLRRHRLRRLHRKIAVIDWRIGYVGGINIIDDANAPAGHAPRYDYAVRAEGPVVAQIHGAVRRMWEMVAWANFKRRFRLDPLPALPRPPAVGGQAAAFLMRDNIRHRNAILNAYLDAIHEARREIVIANAYFLPGFRFRHALRLAARRGVRVAVLLQGVSDHPLLQYATQTLYGALLKDGIEVFEYRKSFMHAKVAVIDGEWATVGSSNIDPFSLLLAKEGNLVVRDPDFAAQLRASLQAAMDAGASRIDAAGLAAQPWHARLLNWLSYGLVRAAMGLAGVAPEDWLAGEEESPARPRNT